MAKNRAYAEANQLSVPVPAGTESGDPVQVGDLNGVALIDRGTNTEGEATVQFDGAFYYEVDGPLDAGDPVSIQDIGGDGSNTVFGHVTRDVPDDDGVRVPVRIANPVS